MPIPAVKLPSEPPPTAASSSLQFDLAGNRLRFFVKGRYSSSALHREAVDAAGHFESALLVERLEGAQLAVKTGGLFCALDADIDAHRSLGRDHIGTGSALRYARVYRNALPQIVELGDHRDLAGQFENGAVSFAGIESGVGSDAFHPQRVFAYPFARGFDGASKPGGGFEHQHSGRLFRQSLSDLSRRMAADFFIGNQEHRDGPRELAVPCLQGCDGMEHERDA